MKKTAMTALIILGILGLAAVRLLLYPASQAVRIVEKTLDADNVIYNYEYFKQAYRDVLAMDKKIVTAREALGQFDGADNATLDFRDKEERARLRTNLTGIQNVRNDMIATYNARASMANRSIFMGRDVPEHIEQ